MALTNEDLQAIGQLLNESLKPINDRLDKIESDVSALKVSQRAIKDKVTDTYNLALEAWGQSTENRHWLENEKAI